ncbi:MULTISPECIES: HNH endonuclease [Pseudomonas syringae group]|uniref:HNH endonuclease n=1 Tax=Pseudomonas syringae group TaxID=136849 RepID=UPI0001E291FC|nr:MULTISPECIES: HNH endonuclease [Pseudomonas syringae group]
MKHPDISLNRVLELLDYDPATGSFMWKPKPAGHRRKDSGYVSIEVDGLEIKAHRLAWFIAKGQWPDSMIDHINGDPSDNRIENLRDVSQKVNSQNLRRHMSNSTTRLLGVTWHKARSKWQATIKHEGKNKYLGLYDTPEEASAAYISAKRLLHEGCTI